MNCPKCSKSLRRIRSTLKKEFVHGEFAGKQIHLSVDQCFSCNGIWFDAGELESYLDLKLVILNSPAIESALIKQYDDKTGLCPACNIPMEKLPASKKETITIDKCSNCFGIWLDSTEIDALEELNDESIHKFFGVISSIF